MLRIAIAKLAQSKLRFARSESGSVLPMFAAAALALFICAGVAIDYSRVSATRNQLAVALDVAALHAATMTNATDAQLKIAAENAMNENYLGGEFGPLTDFTLVATTEAIDVSATAQLKTSFMQLIGKTYIDVTMSSEAMRAGNSLEISLVLDTTGSMAGSKIASLKTAAKDFTDIVVWDDQSQSYSKVSIAPYSMGVNPGAYLAQAIGNITPGTCNTPGCGKFRFNPATGGGQKIFDIGNCVSERTGPEAYTDAPVATAKVGLNYPAPGNGCLSNQILPLTSNKPTIHASIDALNASGSTAGQVGVAWGWYLLSPSFGLWTGNSVPAAYGTDRLQKIMILMTDGEYNSSYCNGVISQDLTPGSGSTSNHINCNATNGNSYTQANTLCTAIKQKGVVVYTIAFELVNSQNARDLMTNCATDSSHAYTAASEAELIAVFREIGKNVMTFRLSK